MKELSQTWITDGMIDFEMKQYVLLGYLKEVNENFTQNKLYPYLRDVIHHQISLLEYKRKKGLIKTHFPKTLKGVDLDNLSLIYEDKIEDDPTLQEIDDIIDYAIPEMQSTIDKGKGIFDQVGADITLETVGLVSDNDDTGIIIVESDLLRVFEYKLTNIILPDEDYKILKTSEITGYPLGSKTYKEIKNEIFLDSDEKTTYLVRSKRQYPVEETMFPVAKRVLLSILSK